MSEKSTKEKLSSYVTLKIVQTVVCLVLFAIGGVVLVLAPLPDDAYLFTHIVTWAMLLNGILAAIFTVILHNGNKNDDTKTLKTFIRFGRLHHSDFDKCAGRGFPLVEERIEEIEGGPQLAQIDKV